MKKLCLGLTLLSSVSSFATVNNIQSGFYVIQSELSNSNCRMERLNLDLEGNRTLAFSLNEQVYPSINLKENTSSKIAFTETQGNAKIAFRGAVFLNSNGTLFLNTEAKIYSDLYDRWRGTRLVDTIWRGSNLEISAVDDSGSIQVKTTYYSRPYSGDMRNSEVLQNIKHSEATIDCIYSRESRGADEVRNF